MSGETSKKKLKIALAALFLLGSVGVFVWLNMSPSESNGPKLPEEFFLLCTQCDAQWEADGAEAGKLFGGMPNYTKAINCPKCNAEKSAFAKTQCPWCNEYYLPKYLITDSKAARKADICSHCKKDTFKWKPTR